jgi:hypothetical protein
MSITVTALLIQIWSGVRHAARGSLLTPTGELSPVVVNAAVAGALLMLAVIFVSEAIKAVRASRGERAPATA